MRTTYAITPAGRDELRRLLRAFWTPPTRTARAIDVALQFVSDLSADEVELLLRERLQALDNQIAVFGPDDLRPQFDDAATQARVDDLHDHELRLLVAERGWCEHILERVRSGAYGRTPAQSHRNERAR